MLEQAIIDAKQLREAALKSAESSLKEKYALELEKMFMSKLNEESDFSDSDMTTDEPIDDMGGNDLSEKDDKEGDDIDAPDGQEPEGDRELLFDDEGSDSSAGGMPGGDEDLNLGDFGNKEDDVEAQKPTYVLDQLEFAHEDEDGQVIIDLGDLEIDDDEPLDMNDKIEASEEDHEDGKNKPKPRQEDDFLTTESLADMMHEILSEEDQKINSLEEKLEEKWSNYINEIKKKFNSKISQLEEKLNKSVEINSQLIEKLNKTTLVGLKLSYKNKTLNDDSLNERQKRSICKAISGASDFEQAKKIYESLKESIKGTDSINRNRTTINEQISQNSRSSMFVKRSQINQLNESDEKINSEDFKKLQRLAGIIK